MNNRLGIIAGSGDLPIIIANAYSQNFSKEIFVAIIDNQANELNFTPFNCQTFNIAKVGQILGYFKNNDITNIVIAGKVNKVDFKSLSLDLEGAKLIAKLISAKFLGDDKLLRIVASYIESKGFVIKSPLDFIDNNIKPGKIKPSKRNLEDIEYGILAAQKLGELDIGQSVIVEGGSVLGVEAAEGTDALIERCSKYSKSPKTAVLVKVIKPGQDKRLDIPVIGDQTITNAHKANMAGVAIQKGAVIALDGETLVRKADELGLFIHLF